MQIYTISNSKKKELNKSIFWDNYRKRGKFVKISRVLTIVLRVLAILACIYSVYINIKNHAYAIEYTISFFYLLIGIGISFITDAIVKGSCNDTIMFRQNEVLKVDGDSYCYSYGHMLASSSKKIYNYLFTKTDITKIEYDESTGRLTLYGTIKENVVYNDTVIETNDWAMITLINAFSDFDLYCALTSADNSINDNINQKKHFTSSKKTLWESFRNLWIAQLILRLFIKK